MSSTTPKNWEEEFDKRFVKTQNDSGQFVKGKPVEWQYISGSVEDIKSFIQSQQDEFKKTLNSGYKMYQIGKKDEQDRIVKEVEGKIDINPISDLEIVYNQALDDILQMIKEI